VTMTRLRKVLARAAGNAEFVATAFGRGYRFVRPVMRCASKVVPHDGNKLRAGSPTGLVGRDGVLNTMRSVLSEVALGRGHALLVYGEPGIGKTSIVDVLAREAEAAGFAVTWGYCRERGTALPLWPFVQLVRGTLAKVPLDVGDGRLRAAKHELSRLVPELESNKPSSGSNPSHAFVDPAARHRMFDAVTQVLLAAASARTCVLVLEDSHNGDEATLELLRYLIDELTDARLLVLATSRAPVSTLFSLRNCTCLPLHRLSEAEVAHYIAASAPATPSKLVRAIFSKSRGNPFIVHEFVRQLHAEPRMEPGVLMFSNAALALACQRLEGFHERVRCVLDTAAVIGSSFELPLLEAAVGLESSALMSSLEAAWASGVVVRAPDSLTAFAFEHELLREALYTSLAPDRRRSIHRAVADALERRSKAGDAAPACTFAHHLYAALPQT
jgi:predicted ATPase